MRTSAWISLLGLVGLAVACGDQPTEVLPEKELAQGPGMIALATASSDDGLSITTDQNDYAPGDTVWFTGAGWPAEDTLDILLTDDTGDEHRWSIATAEDGTFRDSTYVVNDGDLNVTFTLSATSRSTGRYLTVTFTDANPSVSAITLSPTRPDPSASPFTASFTVSINGSVTSPWRSTGWRIYPKGSASGAYTCVNTADRTTVGTSALTVLTLSTPSIVGEYTLDVQTYSDDGTACATRVGSGETLDFFVGTPDLTISKTHTGSFAASGTGSYLITVTNSGNLVSNGPISVTDALPSGFTFSSASGSGWNCPTPAGTTLVCTRGGGGPNAIAAGADAPAITLTVNVASSATGTITNSVSVSGGGETNASNNSASDPTSITGLNAAPVVNARGPYSGDEGADIAIAGTASDADASDNVTTTWTYAPVVASPDASCAFGDDHALSTTIKCTDNGTFTLTLSGTDGKISTPVTSTATLTVGNVAPTATGLSTNSPVDEGNDIVFSLTGVTDASSVDATSLRYAFDCGDGTFSASTYATASSTNSATCSTTDNGTRTVRGEVFDKDGGISTIKSAEVTINNVPPTISTVVANPGGQLTLGSNNQVSTTVTVAFTDPAGTHDEDYTTSITCDNGAAAVTGSPKTYGSSSATCTYTAATVGVRTISATVTDKDGGASTAKTTTVQVIYNWTGFYQPVDNNNLNVAKAGSAIPVKFNLGGNQGLNIFWTADPKAYPNSSQVNCNNINDNQDSIEETVNAGNSSLTYDNTAQQYVYVWKSEKSWAGTCRRLDVKLADGTMHQAYFKWTK